MCIAILNNGKSISKSKLKTCWDNNDDGAGMLYIQDGVLVAEKFPNEGLQNDDNFAKFYERYNAVKSSESGDLPMLVHFRIATHGTTPEYLHPFFVSDTLGLIHNGIIHGFGSAEFSDTAEFTNLLSKLPGVTSCDILDNPFVNDAIHMYLETSNKLVFLDNTGEYRIFNEQMGEWIGDNWFSNDSHTKRVRYYVRQSNPKVVTRTELWTTGTATTTTTKATAHHRPSSLTKSSGAPCATRSSTSTRMPSAYHAGPTSRTQWTRCTTCTTKLN